VATWSLAAAAPAGKPFAPPGASAWGQRQLIHSPTRGRQIAAARWTPKHARSAEVGGGSGLPEPAPAATGAEREEASRRCLDWRDTPVAPLGQKPRVRITGAGEGPAGGEREEAPGEASEVGAVEGRLASMGEMRSSSSSLLTSELAESASAGEEKHGLTGEAGSVMRRARALAGRRYCSGDEWCSSMARLSAAEAEAAAVVVVVAVAVAVEARSMVNARGCVEAGGAGGEGFGSSGEASACMGRVRRLRRAASTAASQRRSSKPSAARSSRQRLAKRSCAVCGGWGRGSKQMRKQPV
jgi:hypothetical protein